MEIFVNDFRINLSWLPPTHGPAEISQTAAAIEIHVCGKNATLVDDEWSRSVQSNIRVSAYPLALWIAGAWWRLRWEPFPSAPGMPQISWRMSHEMPSAGFGFLWPVLLFDSDGLSIGVHCKSKLDSNDPVRFLEHFHASVPASLFESVIDDFINTVLARLSACGVEETPLQQLWQIVVDERRDPHSTRQRKFEALLGFDPGDAPDEVLQRLDAMSKTAGAAAVDEIAPLCAGNPMATIDAITSMVSAIGLEGHPAVHVPTTAPHSKPWELGWQLAHNLRRQLGLNGEPVLDSQLTDLLAIPSLPSSPQTSGRAPLSLAIRDTKSGTFRFLFRRRNMQGIRFEAARFLCEHLLSPADDRWLPVTDIRTNRQKTQRAFAVEFLCPIDPLRNFLANDYSEEAIDRAAEYFIVSPRAVTSTLVNHGDLPLERIAE